MAELDNASRAQLLIDGHDVNSNTPGISSSDTSVASLADINGKFYVVGQTPGTATITASVLGRTGSLDVTVTAAPFVLTLGPAEPK